MLSEVDRYLEMLQFGVFASATAATLCLILIVFVLVLNGKVNQLLREMERRDRR